MIGSFPLGGFFSLCGVKTARKLKAREGLSALEDGGHCQLDVLEGAILLQVSQRLNHLWGTEVTNDQQLADGVDGVDEASSDPVRGTAFSCGVSGFHLIIRCEICARAKTKGPVRGP
jgi:hypothetical protein